MYYVYSYLREDYSPYYIGKGHGDRAYRRSSRKVKPPKDNARIKIIKANLTEEEAFLLEKLYILMFGRKDLGTGILRNKTDGGDGASGAVRSEETREKLRQASLGKKLSPETIKKREETRRKNYENGPKKVLSEETRKKISETLTGRKVGPFSEEHRRKISEANKGKTFIMAEETKKKISETMKGKHSAENNPFYGKKHSEENKRKISKIHKGRKITDEEREKRSNKIWINNGIKSTRHKKDQPIPEGWIRGRLPKNRSNS